MYKHMIRQHLFFLVLVFYKILGLTDMKATQDSFEGRAKNVTAG